jgi:hypothetical protein
MSGFMSHPPVVHAGEAASPQHTTMTYEKTMVVSNCAALYLVVLSLVLCI